MTIVEGEFPAVSIVIPTYNHAHFLVKALDSVLSQTFINWEAIVVNNFSTDNTEEVVASFKDKRIRLINFANNGIIAAARNKGIENSRGDFVAFLDSDDRWYPEKLQECINKLHQEQSDLVTHYLIKNVEGLLSGPLKPGPSKKINFKNLLLRGNCIANSSVVLRKKCLTMVGGLSENRQIITAEDYDLWLKLAWEGVRFSTIEKPLGEYYIHGNNQSSVVERLLNAKLKVLEFHFQKIFNSTSTIARLYFKLKKYSCFAVAFYYSGRQATSQRKFKDAFQYFFQSLKFNPFRLKTYAAISFTAISLWKKNEQ